MVTSRRWREESVRPRRVFKQRARPLNAGVRRRSEPSMPYVGLELSPSTPVSVQRYIRHNVEALYFADVHAMLRLPLPSLGITAGQNFAMAQVLLSVISAVSTCLYKSDGESGPLFREAVEHYFPWNQETASGTPKAVAGTIYDVFRNPLTHSTGVFMERNEQRRYVVVKKYAVGIKRCTKPNGKEGLDEAWIEDLERSQVRPPMLGPTLQRDADSRTLLVEGLYWCTRRMIERLSLDAARMTSADAFLRTFA